MMASQHGGTATFAFEAKLYTAKLKYLVVLINILLHIFLTHLSVYVMIIINILSNVLGTKVVLGLLKHVIYVYFPPCAYC